ncbi:MAG: hypothetical protein FWF43_08455 [Propionibacteriaceae bacterium]|nr:hypothetical protein [Propionibacteriaceae bacterium]
MTVTRAGVYSILLGAIGVVVVATGVVVSVLSPDATVSATVLLTLRFAAIGGGLVCAVAAVLMRRGRLGVILGCVAALLSMAIMGFSGSPLLGTPLTRAIAVFTCLFSIVLFILLVFTSIGGPGTANETRLNDASIEDVDQNPFS